MANIIEMQLKSYANRVNVQKINVTNEVITSKYRHLNFGQNVLFDVIFKFQTSMHQFSIFLFFFFCLSVERAHFLRHDTSTLAHGVDFPHQQALSRGCYFAQHIRS